jgi:hypothetical protein
LVKIEDIFISTTLAEYDDLLVPITEETWSHIVDRVRLIEVTLEEPDDSPSSGVPPISKLDDGVAIGPPEGTTSSNSHQGVYCLASGLD